MFRRRKQCCGSALPSPLLLIVLNISLGLFFVFVYPKIPPSVTLKASRCYFAAILSIKYSFCSSFCATERSKEPGTEIRDSNKTLRSGRFVFAVVVFTQQIRERSNSLCTFTVQRCFPCAQTSSVLFPRLPLTTTHAHTVPFLGDYFCNGEQQQR